MANIFKLIISHETFEQSPNSKSTLNKTYEGCEVYNVEEIFNLHIKFIDYVKNGDEYTGVKLLCDHGQGYGFSNGREEVTLVPDDVYHFVYEGTCVDDDGCPEDFSIDYYISISAYNEE